MNLKVSVNLNIQTALFIENFIGKFEWGPLWDP